MTQLGQENLATKQEFLATEQEFFATRQDFLAIKQDFLAALQGKHEAPHDARAIVQPKHGTIHHFGTTKGG